MKVEFTLSIGISNARQEEIIDIDDSELDGKSELEIENYLDDYWKDWSSNFIDGGFVIKDKP